MMLGLIRPTAGTVRLFGRDPLRDRPRRSTGVAGFVEAPTFYPYMNARRNLELLAAFDGDGARSRIDAALETVELSDRADDKVGGYSHGMRQRLGIAAALLREPKLLLLDEPATGLDPAGMRDMRLLITRLADQGMTVLLSSHLLAEVEELCNRVAIVRPGKIVYEGTIDALEREAPEPSTGCATTDDERARAVVPAQPGVERRSARAWAARRSPRDEAAVAELSLALVEAGVLIHELAPQTVTLEDLFFSLTEGEAAPGEPPQRSRPAVRASIVGRGRDGAAGHRTVYRWELRKLRSPEADLSRPRRRGPRADPVRARDPL